MGKMSIKKEQLGKFLISLDNFLVDELRVAVIGGCVLIFYDLEHKTDDIDLVFLQNPPKGVAEFIKLYSEQNRIEIQVGPPERFQSMLMNEDMFDHSLKITKFKTSLLHTYNFKKLQIYMLKFRYYVLVKIEAAAHHPKHFEEALRLVRHFNLPKQELIFAYEEYRPEIECMPGMVSSFRHFINNAYGSDR